jgi:hypothetical protein
MNESLSLTWNPLKNDSNIEKEWNESTTINFTSIRQWQWNERVGRIEWTEVGSLDEIAGKIFLCWLVIVPAIFSSRSCNRSRKLLFCFQKGATRNK